MTSRERFLTALKCEIPDRIPIYDHLLIPNFKMKLLVINLNFMMAKLL